MFQEERRDQEKTAAGDCSAAASGCSGRCSGGGGGSSGGVGYVTDGCVAKSSGES